MLRSLAVAVGFMGMASVASAVTLDFESDAFGFKPNGFSSVDSGLVSFSDTIGGDLLVADYGVQSDGQALSVNGDDASQLQMDFSQAVFGLGLDFGNDDPGFIGVGGLAVLQGYLGGGLVLEATVVVNRDDIMNQSISLGGAVIDQAFFYYAEANGSPANLIEVVDNITFEATVVPLPATLPLLVGGVAGIAALRRRRRG